MTLNAVAHGVDTVLDRSIVGGFSKVGYAVRRRLPTWPADPPPGALAGRSVIVTGGSSGLGLQTVVDLAGLGAHVQVVVRNLDKARAALSERGLDERTSLWQCDIGDLDSVRAFADSFLEAKSPVDGIVHNAGAMPPERTESPQGHELSMAVHVLGPVLMTELLRPAMAGQDIRVQLVTSGGMYGQALPADDPEYLAETYAPATAYARSKRTQVELLGTLEHRWFEAHVYAVHPGWAATPGVTESLPRFAKFAGPILRTPATGTDTTVWLAATQPAPPGGGLWQDRAERPVTWFGRNEATAAQRDRIWRWVARSCGLDLDA